jgi:hypothetical protein
MTKKRIGKLAGYVSTLAVFVVGIMPSTFNIPTALRPWIFLVSIVWFVAFSSGVFSS